MKHRPPRPYEQLTDEEKARFDREWQKDHRSHAFIIQPDGSFRVQDIIPGEYQLSIQIHDDYEEPRFHGFIVLGKTERTITVPGLAGGQPAPTSPLDLGLIPFELERRPSRGPGRPEVVARTLDGRPVKLSDFRGKSVLLVFWQSETVLDRADALALKAVASRFGRNDRLVMLGLSADTQGDEAAAGPPPWLDLAPGEARLPGRLRRSDRSSRRIGSLDLADRPRRTRSRPRPERRGY